MDHNFDNYPYDMAYNQYKCYFEVLYYDVI